MTLSEFEEQQAKNWAAFDEHVEALKEEWRVKFLYPVLRQITDRILAENAQSKEEPL